MSAGNFDSMVSRTNLNQAREGVISPHHWGMVVVICAVNKVAFFICSSAIYKEWSLTLTPGIGILDFYSLSH